jgi:molecular chaperone DnaJ
MSHPIFQRQDYNLYSTAPISFAQAALGGDVRITTIDGDVLFPIKAGTQTDTKIRLKGKGVPSLRNKNLRGDHYVTLIVQVPEKLNALQRDALIQFDKSMGGEATKDQPETEPENEENGKKKGKKKKLFG